MERGGKKKLHDAAGWTNTQSFCVNSKSSQQTEKRTQFIPFSHFLFSCGMIPLMCYKYQCGSLYPCLLCCCSPPEGPDPPTDLELTDQRKRSVQLTWTPGDEHNSPIQSTYSSLPPKIPCISAFKRHILILSTVLTRNWFLFICPIKIKQINLRKKRTLFLCTLLNSKHIECGFIKKTSATSNIVYKNHNMIFTSDVLQKGKSSIENLALPAKHFHK